MRTFSASDRFRRLRRAVSTATGCWVRFPPYREYDTCSTQRSGKKVSASASCLYPSLRVRLRLSLPLATGGCRRATRSLSYNRVASHPVRPLDMLCGGLQGRLVFDIHLHHVQPVVPSSSPSKGVQIRGGGRVPARRNHRSCTHGPSQTIIMATANTTLRRNENRWTWALLPCS